MNNRQYKAAGFSTPSGKVELYRDTMAQLGLDPLPSHIEPMESPLRTPELAADYPLILTSAARQKHYTHSPFREIPGFIKKTLEAYAEIHPITAGYYGIGDGDTIVVESKRGSIEIKARTTEDILPHVINIPHGRPQSNVKVLTDETPADPATGYAALKSLLCKIRPKT